jgi:hypothetical protein
MLGWLLVSLLVGGSLADGDPHRAQASAAAAEQYDPLYSQSLSGAGHDSPPPPPPPPRPIVSTVEALNVAKWDRLIPDVELPWLVLYISCAASIPLAQVCRRTAAVALPLAGTGTAALPHPWCALCVSRAASELQAYQQELRNQATALAGHLRLGWLDCSEPGNDVICEEQLSRTTLDSSGGAEQEEDEQDDASDDTQEFDPARLPVAFLCDRLSPSTGGLLR